VTASTLPTSLHVGDVAEGTPYASYGPVTHIETYGFALEHCAVEFANGMEIHLVCGCPIGGAA
jgi:hypothetical protein